MLFAWLVSCVFISWAVHEALQELMFSFDGFNFGVFMALCLQVGCVVGSLITQGIEALLKQAVEWRGHGQQEEEDQEQKRGQDGESKFLGGGEGEKEYASSATIGLHLVGLAGAIALSGCLANASLSLVQQPVKVLFKSCKLVPTMALRVAMGNSAKNSALDYAFAISMCMGLAVFSLADATSKSARFSWAGVAMLTGAVVFDAVAPNLQEKLLRRYQVKQSTVVLHTNWISVVGTAAVAASTGELGSAWQYVAVDHPRAGKMLLLQTFAGYCGIQFFLKLVGTYGSKTAVIVTSTRKMFTIGLSFVMFAKPFRLMHFVGMTAVVGVILASAFIKKPDAKKAASGGGGGGRV